MKLLININGLASPLSVPEPSQHHVQAQACFQSCLDATEDCGVLKKQASITALRNPVPQAGLCQIGHNVLVMGSCVAEITACMMGTQKGSLQAVCHPRACKQGRKRKDDPFPPDFLLVLVTPSFVGLDYFLII